MGEGRDGRTVGLVLSRKAGHQLGMLLLEAGDETGQVRQVDNLLAEHVLGRRTSLSLCRQGFPQRLRGPMCFTEVPFVEPVGRRAVLGHREVGECAQGSGRLPIFRLGHAEQVGELRQLTGRVLLKRCVARADTVGQAGAQGAYGLLKLTDGPGLTLGTGEGGGGRSPCAGHRGRPTPRRPPDVRRPPSSPAPGKGVSLGDGAPRPADGFGRRKEILQRPRRSRSGRSSRSPRTGRGAVSPACSSWTRRPRTSCRVRPRGSLTWFMPAA